jgi:hypothetical protein
LKFPTPETFAKPIDQDLVVDIDFCGLNSRVQSDLDSLFLWCREAWVRSALTEFQEHKQALSRFFLGAMLLTEPVLEVMRRELRRVSPEVRIETEQIKAVLVAEVIKREVMEGEKAVAAQRKITRSSSKSLRAMPPKATGDSPTAVAPEGSGEQERQDKPLK